MIRGKNVCFSLQPERVIHLWAGQSVKGEGGVAKLIYAQYAHLYYYGLWMRSNRINLIESSMCHKNPETEMKKEKEKENEREGGRWTETAAKPSGNCHALAKWQAKPRLVDVAPTTTTTALCGKWVAISWLDWLADWETDRHCRDSLQFGTVFIDF